jgi:C4-type Zn-finger protein
MDFRVTNSEVTDDRLGEAICPTCGGAAQVVGAVRSDGESALALHTILCSKCGYRSVVGTSAQIEPQ